MRPLARIIAAPLFLVAACSSGTTESAVDESLARDLRLASTSSLALAPMPSDAGMALETAPLSAPTPAPTPRRAASGERRVRSETPTATAAPVAQQSAGTDAESVLETITQPTAEVALEDAGDGDEGVALPRPVPVSIEGTGVEGTGREGGYEGSGDRGRGDGGWGWGGVVIRGGDIDDCRIEPRRTARRPVRRPSGGIGSSRWPVADRGQRTTGGGAVWNRGTASSGGSRGGSSGGGGVWSRRN